jgi:dienelactone hydrolase
VIGCGKRDPADDRPVFEEIHALLKYLDTVGVDLCRASLALSVGMLVVANSISSAQTGPVSLTFSLDNIAQEYTAARAAEVAAIHTRAVAELRKTEVRKKIQALIGELPQRTPLHAKVLGETHANGFRIQKVLYESQPNFPVTALLYLPDGEVLPQKRPAILITPGHYPTGKAADVNFAAMFARNGFVVLSYDPIGEGERLQYPDPSKPGNSLATAPTGEHGEASLQPMLIGDTLARYMVWDAMRGVDYLAGLPEVDSKRIGAYGCSGGGTITALLGALDTRVAAIGVACYITSFDKLLPALGPQDAEQSSPRFISSGLDFPDLIEVAAPRRYAVISTYSDMFPFDGARSSVAEARRFYSLFDSTSAGTPSYHTSPSMPPIPSAPALNCDTTNLVPPASPLQFITGPGRHAALSPLMNEILSFFERNLQSGKTPRVQPPRPSSSSESEPIKEITSSLLKDALQVTQTGQVSTSYHNSETVFSLNQKRAIKIIAARQHSPTLSDLAAQIREVAATKRKPGTTKPAADLSAAISGPIVLPASDGVDLQGELAIPAGPGRHPAVLLLVPGSIHGDNAIAKADKSKFDSIAAAGNIVLAIALYSSDPDKQEMKSPLLGPSYLLTLRADLVGRTLLGIGIDDTIQAIDYLVSRNDVDLTNISGEASGHLGLVLAHAGVLDLRLRRISVDHVLRSYRSLIDAPMPIGAAEDILPGVLLRYDIPDLRKVLGSRLTVSDSLEGSSDLSQSSAPLSSDAH